MTRDWGDHRPRDHRSDEAKDRAISGRRPIAQEKRSIAKEGGQRIKIGAPFPRNHLRSVPGNAARMQLPPEVRTHHPKDERPDHG